MIVPIVPESSDAITPALETLFQKSINNKAGPKDEPMPDQAYETILKMESLGFSARKNATNPTSSVMILLNHNSFFAAIFLLAKFP